MTTVFIISAPSGSGKSTLVNRLMTEVPGLTFSVSCTTRAPRGSEVSGQAYDFIDRSEFERRIAQPPPDDLVRILTAGAKALLQDFT